VLGTLFALGVILLRPSPAPQCIVDKRPSGCGSSLVTVTVGGETHVIVEDSAGILWVGSGSTVHKITSGGSQLLTLSPGATVSDIAVDSDGLIWVAAGSSAKRYAAGGALQKTITPGGTVNALAADPLNPIIWIGAGNEAYKYNFAGTQLKTFTASGTANALMILSDGTVWVGAGSTVHKLSAGGSQIASFSAGASVTDLLEDNGGSIWVAAGNTVKKYAPAATGAVLQTLSPGATVKDIDLDAAGPIWVAAGNRAWKYATGGALLCSVDEGDPVTAVGSSSFGAGPVWVGVCLTAPSINVSPSSLSFGNVVEGNSSTKQFTIQNTGTAALNFSISSTNAMYTAAPSTGTISPSGSQTINVTFAPPTGTPPGSQTGTLNITHNDPNQISPKEFALTANVVAATRIIDVSPTTLDFGKVGIYYSFAKVITVRNSGNSILTVTNISSTSPRFQVNHTFPFSVQPSGGEEPVEVTFSPISAGVENGELAFASNATNANPTVSLTGNGILPPPVDAYLVLDRSGSMSESAGSSLTKMDRLQSAANLFVDLARTGQGDKLGIVQFDYPTTDYMVHLGAITTSSKTTMKNAVNTLIPSGWTSIGQGLNLAFNELTDPSISTASHRVLLLLSDGKENRLPFVDPANGTPVITFPTQPNIEIYAVGFGLAQNMNSALLSNLAFNSVGTTKGYFHLTQDNWYTLHKFFISIFGDTFNEYLVQDPVYHIGSGETITIPVTIVDSDKSATFAVYWTNRESRLRVELLSPEGTTITPETAGHYGAQYVLGDLYTFYRVSFISESRWVGEKRGLWTLGVTGVEIPSGVNKEILSVSVLTPSDLSFNPFLNQGVYSTGDVILLSTELLERGRPVEADKVVVTVTKPNNGLGNILSTHELSDRDYKIQLGLNLDTISDPRFNKVAILQRKSPTPLISYDEGTLLLFDDGLHGDGSAGDGIWANFFTDTQVEGVYTFGFQASVRSRLDELTTREKTLSTTVAVTQIDPSKTTIRIDRVPIDVPGFIGYKVAIVPKDAFGNFMGPGYANLIAFRATGAEFVGLVDDDNAGEYSRILHLPSSKDVNDVLVEVDIFGNQINFNLGEELQRRCGLGIWILNWWWLILIFLLFVLVASMLVRKRS